MINSMNIERANILKGSLFATFAFFCMALFGITTKLALVNSSYFWVSFISYAAGALALLPYIFSKGFTYLKSEHYNLLFLRAIIGTLASFCYTISLNYIPIVNGTLLFNTAPIFIPLLSMLFLNTKISKSIWMAVVVGFIGIIVIIKPTEAIFKDPGNLIALFSGLSLAVAYLTMKILTSTDPGIKIIFYYLAIGALLQIPLIFFTPFSMSLESFFYAVTAGLLLMTAQLGLVRGYKYASASEIGIYQYLSVVFVALLNWMVWNSVPTLIESVGILIVSLAGIIIIRSGK